MKFTYEIRLESDNLYIDDCVTYSRACYLADMYCTLYFEPVVIVTLLDGKVIDEEVCD